MKGNSIFKRGFVLAVTVAIAFVAMGPVNGASASSAAGMNGGVQPSPVILPPVGKYYGHTYTEWGNMWWKWAFSIPVDENPLFDESGANCGVGQSGPVFYLAGVFNESGTATRTECVVPANKALFIPILNYEASNVEGNGTTVDELRANVNGFLNGTNVDESSLELDVDGMHLRGNVLKYYRTNLWQAPGGYNFTLPENNLLGKDAGSCYYPDPNGPCVPYLSVQAGYYVMVAPLARGKHTIHFHGEIPSYPFTLDITYDQLTVR